MSESSSKQEIQGWKNPYILYIGLTTLLFLFLILMGYLAWENGWIPNRGFRAT